MNYISVCSGIEAASVAWHRIPNWTPVAFAEIEKFPSAVLAHHFPQVPNLGDMTKFHEWPDFNIQLLVGGCPCQAFSVAGLREGLNDPRGNLTLTFLGVAARYKPKWIVYENVPGILSDKTDAFGCLIAGLVELGYGVAWRFHDAQFTGLAQRRKRVFVVACLGDWASASEVLFESDCLRWNPPPSREARKEVTGTLSARTEDGGGLGTDFDLGGGLVSRSLRAQAQSAHDTTMETYVAERAHRLCARMAKGGDPTTDNYVAHTLRAGGFDASEDGTGRGTPVVAIPLLEAGARTGKSTTDIRAGSGIGDDGDPMFTLQRGKQHAVAVHENQRGEVTLNDTTGALTKGGGKPGQGYPRVAFNWNAQVDQMNFDPNTTPSLTCSQGAAIGPVAFAQNQAGEVRVSNVTNTLNTNSNASGRNAPLLHCNMAVRRLTPTECERLQGFPDHWTNIPWRGKAVSPDGPRYKALGNSMAVPCMRWIGERIAMVDSKPRILDLED